MNDRPLLLRMLPDHLRVAVWARLYRGKTNNRTQLYNSASLYYAPGVRMEVIPGDILSDCIAFTGLYEISLTRRLVSLANKGGIMIDVGANLGYFSLLWVAANKKNRCFAFEASPRNIGLLCRNVNRNGFQRQVEVISKAAGREPGILQFDLGPAEQRGWGGFTREAGDNTINVEVVRIDEAVNSTDKIALLKIDIEGADAWALMGCERLLRERRVREVWFEQNKPRIRALGLAEDAAQQFLRSVGYKPIPCNDPNAELVEWYALPQ